MKDVVIVDSVKYLFLEQLWAYYDQDGRHDLPWRSPQPDGSFTPYHILVSELMLQQTQVNRVIQKYRPFLERFPTVTALARAELGEVLRLWQGLGYNRRAKYLWQAARAIDSLGRFPDSSAGLTALPGVGVNTAGAIQAYAFNQPALFVETNIRTVYIHHFLPKVEAISDSVIRSLLEQTIDTERPREFYWALMDYGSGLKRNIRTNTQSKHYARQTKFEGSRRQVRGQILRALTSGSLSRAELANRIADKRLDDVLMALQGEGLVVKKGAKYQL